MANFVHNEIIVYKRIRFKEILHGNRKKKGRPKAAFGTCKLRRGYWLAPCAETVRMVAAGVAVAGVASAVAWIGLPAK